MRYIPAILAWVLLDLILCVVTLVLIAAIIATTSMDGQLDAHAAGYRVGQATVVAIKHYWLRLPD